MTRQRRLRELALRVLYGVEAGREDAAVVIEELLSGEAVAAEGDENGETPELSETERESLRRLVQGVVEQREELDGIIARLASRWRLDRIAAVDRNVLRLALYEIIYRPETPHSIVINEAVELAKRYSTADSGKFVNGILGTFVRSRDAGPADSAT
jgi:transcription antitermination protein NusB